MVASGQAFFQDGQLRCDFVGFYETGKIALCDDRFHPYDNAVQHAWLNKLAYPRVFDRPPFIQYMPYVFSIMAPFATLPIQASFIVWDIFCISLAIIGMLKLMRTVHPDISNKVILCIIFAVLGSEPAFMTYRTGQSGFLLLSMFSLFYSGLIADKPISGLAAAVTTIKPQYVFCWGIPSLFKGRGMYIVSAALGVFILLCIAACTMGIENIINYPSYLLGLEHSGLSSSVLGPVMISLRGPFTGIFGDQIGFKMILASCAISSLAIMYLWWKIGKSRRAIRWAIATTMVWQLLFSVHIHDYDLILLAIPAICTLPEILDEQCRQETAVKFWLALLVSFPLLGWIPFFLMFGLHFPAPTIWSFTAWLAVMLVTAALITVKYMNQAEPNLAPD